MSVLESVLREKRLRRMQRLQQLAEARARRDASDQMLQTCQHRTEQARAHLWQTMNADELCVQRLMLARLQENHARRMTEQAVLKHEENVRDLEAAERVLARIEKDIEKLTERQEAQRAADASMRQIRGWCELDDWVAARRGAESS